MSTKSLMAALSDCFPSSSCLLLRKYWNQVPNNIGVRVKETKIWLPFKTRCSLSVPGCRPRTTQETETLDGCIKMEKLRLNYSSSLATGSSCGLLVLTQNLNNLFFTSLLLLEL